MGGRDINLAIGPMFDDVTVNVLYNVISTIVEQTITSVEMFVAYNIDAPEEVIDLVEDIFDSNIPVETDVGLDFEPIEIEEISYESVEIEIAEIEIEEIQVVNVDLAETETVEVSMVDVETEMELEMDLEMEVEDTVEAQPEVQEEPETTTEAPNETESEETNEESVEEVKEESSEKETEIAESKEETNEQEIQEEEKKDEEVKTVDKKESSKEKAAKKILKKIDDKKRYDSTSQLKTLVVMQVLGNTKSFFEDQQELNDRLGFFTDTTLPDSFISDNNIAGYLLFGGSDFLMNEMIDSQWQQK